MMEFDWKPAGYSFRADHFKADTPWGEVIIGPRKNDGGMEFYSPITDDWHGILDEWGWDDCVAALIEHLGNGGRA